MISVEYANAYSEVMEILKHINKEEYLKIPKRKIEVFEKNSNKDYKFLYSPEKTLDEQNVSKIAKAIIGLLFRDYWATEEQKNKIINKQKNDRKIMEEQKKSIYNVDKIFKERVNINKKHKEKTEIIVYKETLLKKIFNKIRALFKINSK